MFNLRSPAEWKRILRFYQAGVVNAGFGYGSYALLVALGLNIYAAQIISHISGMVFNYLTYSRYVFKDRSASVRRYILVYFGQYVISLSALAIADNLHFNAYMAGFISIVFISIVNYFFLKLYVYLERAET